MLDRLSKEHRSGKSSSRLMCASLLTEVEARFRGPALFVELAFCRFCSFAFVWFLLRPMSSGCNARTGGGLDRDDVCLDELMQSHVPECRLRHSQMKFLNGFLCNTKAGCKSLFRPVSTVHLRKGLCFKLMFET
jgi:hypothetical protein